MKPRKRQPYDPYKVTIGGKVRWQVNLPGTSHTKKDGKVVRVRPRRTFSNAEEARTFADLKRHERRNHGVAAVSMDEKLRGDTLAAQKLLAPYGISVLEAAKYCVKHVERLKESETVANAVKSLLESKQADNLRPRYLTDLRLRLKRFSADFGGRLLADIEVIELEAWLRSLSLKPAGRNSYRDRLSVLFAYGCRCGWVDSNPVEQVSKAKVVDSLPGILSPDEAARLLEAAGELTLPYWAIGFFAGLRRAEIERLDWKDIDLDEQTIRVEAKSSKTGSRRFVKILPNLHEWLAPYLRDHRSGPICPSNLRRHLQADRLAAGLTRWPSNGCRHSYGTYHLTHFKNAAVTAAEMGHMTTSMLYGHYHQRVKPADAERFWRIVPAVEGAELIKAIA
jgi:integrase